MASLLSSNSDGFGQTGALRRLREREREREREEHGLKGLGVGDGKRAWH